MVQCNTGCANSLATFQYDATKMAMFHTWIDSEDWTFYTSTERNLCVLQAAKINKCRRALAVQRSAE